MVGKVRSKLGRLNDKKNYPTYNERYHKEFNNVDLDRSSLNEKIPNWIHLGFMQLRTKWPQKNISGCLMTRSRCLKSTSMELKRAQAYPTDRSKELTKIPRRVSHLEKTRARSKDKWSRIEFKL